MKTIRRITLLIIISISSNVYATPDGPNVINRIVLMGITANHLYYLNVSRTWSNETYYEYTDSVFLEKRSLRNNIVEKSELIRVVNSVDTTASGTWQHKDLINPKVDVFGYLKNENTEMIYPKPYLLSEFLIDSTGVGIQENTFHELIISHQELKKNNPWIEKYEADYGYNAEDELRVSSIFCSISQLGKGYKILIIEMKSRCTQGILIISSMQLNDARNRLFKKVDSKK